MPSWNPAAYGYSAERSRPFHDLMARVHAHEPRYVVDLGCGTGALTAALADRWPGAAVEGVDSSPEMLAEAGALSGPRLTFELGDLRDWRPTAPVDVLVSNAALQWVPEHRELLRRWAGPPSDGGVLSARGWLAVQMPGNNDAPSHALMRDVANREPFRERLDGVLREAGNVGEPGEYGELLQALGCTVDVWETTYVHFLDPEGRHGDDAVLRWVTGTGLRPVLDALGDTPQLLEEFVAQYRAELRRAYPRGAGGTALRFRRVFVVAQRP
ncbi:MAG TPA: methyltransferase domain-containing protein [Actinomycetales bacterium]|nr:methyltransferase domain-containing protein [Actinomycetales bacterium]